MTQTDGTVPTFLSGGGETGALVRAHDWAATPLGRPEAWPTALKTAVSLMLGALQPVYVAWGDDLISLYNDGYLPIVGTKHPRGLGQPFAELWAEIWSDFRPIVEATMAGQAQHFVDLPIALAGRPDKPVGYFTFSYTPLRDDEGRIAGFYCAATETTDNVLAEQRQAAERERQRLMLQQMPGFVALLVGPEHRFEYVNDAYVELSGPRDFIGRTVSEVFPEIAAQGFYELLDTVYATGEPFAARALPVQLGHDSGEQRFVDLLYEPVRNDAGLVTGIFVGGYDVTQQMRAEKELKRNEAALSESEDRYRTLFEHIDAAFCVIEVIFDAAGTPVDHRFVEVNPAFAQQTGLENALGRTARELLPDHEQHWFDTYGRIAQTGEPARFENGSDALGKWFDVHALRVGAPEQRRVAILFNDITERKKAEDQLRRLNETLETRVSSAQAERKLMADIIETTDAFVHVLDLDYRWLAINRAGADEFERILGVRPAVGARMLDLLDNQPAQRATAESVWSRALAGEEFTATAEFGELPYPSGTYEMKFNTLRNERGERIGAFQVVTDVSERVRDQARLAEAQEQLRQSQKMEAMGQLTGGVAHDFNNLLSPIVGSLDLLQRKGFGGEREQRLIDGALQSAERAKMLVQRLLAFARRQPLQSQAVDVAALIDGMADLIASTSGPRVRLEIDVAPGLPHARADANQLEMAVLNLAVNARDAMPDGGTLTISAAVETIGEGHRLAPGRYVMLSVADSGEGMDEMTLARAIEPFFSTKGVGKGTGLGLSMVHGLAAQLGGALEMRSRLGLGTHVELWLPATEEAPVSADRTADDDGRRAAGTALLVDDEELVRISTADMLAELGYTVVEAGSAEEALQLLDNGLALDLLVTDHLMPGMTGTELAREIRARQAGTPVLVVSGYAEVEGIAADLPRLAKPFRQADLAARIAELESASA